MSWGTDPVAVMRKLAEVEDSLASMESRYAQAAQQEVALQDQIKLTEAELMLRAQGTIPEKQAWVSQQMRDSPERRQLVEAKSALEYGKAYFKVLDARRSSLQSLLAMHKMTAEEARFGRGRRQQGD